MKRIVFFYILLYISLISKGPEHLVDIVDGFNEKRAHLDNGAIAEYISIAIYKKNGYSLLDTEVGRIGVDGLFVKRDKNGRIKNVVFSEVKYGTAKLSTIEKGSIQQMSNKWKLSVLNRKISQLEKISNPSPKEQKLLNELKSIKKNGEN